MTACFRCGTSDWHPEARRCPFVDCELRQPHELRSGGTAAEAERAPLSIARPVTSLTYPGSVSPLAAGDIVGTAHNDTLREAAA